MESVEKLKLHSIIEAVGLIFYPSSAYVSRALKDLLIEYNAFDTFKYFEINQQQKKEILI